MDNGPIICASCVAGKHGYKCEAFESNLEQRFDDEHNPRPHCDCGCIEIERYCEGCGNSHSIQVECGW